jgi:hypothetical protein
MASIQAQSHPERDVLCKVEYSWPLSLALIEATLVAIVTRVLRS